MMHGEVQKRLHNCLGLEGTRAAANSVSYTMSHFDNLALELVEAILDHLGASSLASALRTAKILQYPSERRLYYRVDLSTPRKPSARLKDCEAIFFDTISKNDRLANHVVKLSFGGLHSAEGDPRVNAVIADSMKKMVNLKRLSISGYPYIMHANIDLVPFSLTHLVIAGDRDFKELDDFEAEPEVPLLPILRAHPELVHLELDYRSLPPSLTEALKVEQKAPSNESGIICPHIKRFGGYDESLRLFLPTRTIESGLTMGTPDEFIEEDQLSDVWLTPALVQSYQHLRFLEVWNTSLLFPIAPYLTSLTHLRARANYYTIRGTDSESDCLLSSLIRMPALESVTFKESVCTFGMPALEHARKMVQLVCSVLPDIAEIFVEGGMNPRSVLFYRYTNGEGLEDDLCGEGVPFDTNITWWLEP